VISNKVKQKGFTLLEVILAMSILSVGLLAVCSMVHMVMNSNSKSKNLTTAVNLAQNKVDDLKITPYASIVDSTENDLDENGTAGSGIFDRAVSVTTNTNPNYKTVVVTVSWKTRQMVLRTIIAQ